MVNFSATTTTTTKTHTQIIFPKWLKSNQPNLVAKKKKRPETGAAAHSVNVYYFFVMLARPHIFNRLVDGIAYIHQYSIPVFYAASNTFSRMKSAWNDRERQVDTEPPSHRAMVQCALYTTHIYTVHVAPTVNRAGSVKRVTRRTSASVLV